MSTYLEYSFLVIELNRIRETRRKRELTQEELSRICSVSQKEISLIENDLKPNFSLAVAKRIARALGQSVDYLWPGNWPD